MFTPPEEGFIAAKFEKVLFVYDVESGDILGAELFSTLPGAQLPPLTELEESVKADAASRLSRPTNELRVATLTAKQYRPGAAYRFDRSKNRLVRVRHGEERGGSRISPSSVTPAFNKRR
jgi:hypothetical protein